MVVGSTKSNDISVSAPSRSTTRSSSSTSCASRTHRATSTGTSRCSSAPKTVGTSRLTRASLARQFVTAVRVDDVLDDAVPHHVARTELHELQAVDAVEDVAHLQQPGTVLAVGEVDLGDVTGYDDTSNRTRAG